MVSISKPLNAGNAQQYHEQDYSSQEQAYYSQDEQITGQWQGKLAEKMGLNGAVTAEHFQQLSEGFHPQTGASLVQQKTAREGSASKTAEHRAGWDATFSAPKSVSLTAIVGEDHRVRSAHREAVSAALSEMERYVNARMGGSHPAQHTGEWAVAKFEHDSARPVDGYSAPQLHTHAFFFNVTQTGDGKTRAVDPQAIYAAQTVGTSVYQAELTYRLARMGYQFEAGKSGAPEIKGYSKEYLEFQSARSHQIKKHLEEHGVEGKEAANLAAKTTRETKVALPPEHQRAVNAAIAAQFGYQERSVVAEARSHSQTLSPRMPADNAEAAQVAVTFAARKVFERESHVTEGLLIREALNRDVGQVRFADLRRDMDRRLEARDLVPMESNRPGHVPRYTSAELKNLERATLQMMRNGQEQHTPIVPAKDLAQYASHYRELNDNQRAAIDATLTARDSMTAIQGGAGTGKTTALAAIRAIAEERGYQVQGFAPTSRAAQQLAEAGIPNSTLQKHLIRGQQADDAQRRLYILDESSLASTRQVHDFLARLYKQDRVVLVGDVRQHQAVDAGTPFQLLQSGGIQTAVLNRIVRQTNTDLRKTVEDLSMQKSDAGFAKLEAMGAVHEIRHPEERKQQLARNYVGRTGSVLVVAPDNPSRYALNTLIHREMQKAERVSPVEHALTIRIARQDLTGADREWAAKYQAGDEVRYEKGSQHLDLKSSSYATVRSVDPATNRITVERADGSEQTYDPQRLKGVTVYRNQERAVSTGDRVQFTAVQKDLTVSVEEGQIRRNSKGVANRETGTISSIDPETAQMRIRLDRGGTVSVSTREKLHLDLGYAVTSHSSQGATTDTVLFYGDNASTNPALINDRLFYVAVSRARESAEIYTDNAAELKTALARDVSKSSALSDREIRGADRSDIEATSYDRSGLDGPSSYDLLQTVMRNYAERFAQTTAAFAAATSASEYTLSPDTPDKPEYREEHREGIQPEQERTPINQQSPLNSYPEIETDLSYPEMEISL